MGATESLSCLQVEYILLRLREIELLRLRSSAPALAVVSSSSAVTLTAASNKASIEKVQNRLTALEIDHGMSPGERRNWVPGYQQYDTALQLLKDREVKR